MDPKALLDELMGKERNVPLTERSNRRMRYDDPSVCKYELGGLCPHRLFKNTKSDLGQCHASQDLEVSTLSNVLHHDSFRLTAQACAPTRSIRTTLTGQPSWLTMTSRMTGRRRGERSEVSRRVLMLTTHAWDLMELHSAVQ